MSGKKADNKILLFVSRESATFGYVRRQVENACGPRADRSGLAVEVIDIADRPDLAERYNIEALPTIIIGSKRFVGAPTQEFLTACLDDERLNRVERRPLIG